MRHEDSEVLADTPRELWTEELSLRHETLLQSAAKLDLALALYDQFVARTVPVIRTYRPDPETFRSSKPPFPPAVE